MALVGILSVSLIYVNLNSNTPTTLKMLRIDDVDHVDGDIIDLGTGTESVVVDARPNDPKAVVEVTGDSGFEVGENKLEIKVTGSDNKTFQIYTITLNKPELSGWCELNADLIGTIETNWADEQIYEMPGYAELGTYAADIKANPSCFTPSLVEEVNTNY
jgi:hypothetical protein